MAYLAALALAAALMLSNIAAEWSAGLEGTLTVQVPISDDALADQKDQRVLSAVRVLLATPGVDSRPIPLAEVAEMLEPWLGAAFQEQRPSVAARYRRPAGRRCGD